MRISFLGKGGSGKTTLSASFIKYLEKKGENILAIDADMNVHLGKVCKLETNPISDRAEEIKNYLEGNRKPYSSIIDESLKDKKAPIIGSTPPSLSSKFIKIKSSDEFIKKYATRRDNLFLLTVGTYNENEVGYSCYHGKLAIAEMVGHHLLDTNDDFVVVDATAGIDSVGTSMFFIADINIFVVEPTKKGISVFKDFNDISEKYGVKTYVIGNKIEDQDDVDFLINEICEEKIIGYVKRSSKMRKYEQGQDDALEEFVIENSDIFDEVYNMMKKDKRDWKKYYNTLVEIYKANAKEWYNEYYGENLERYIDEEFSYKKVIDKND